MASQADFDLFVQSQRNIRTLALRDLRAWWDTVKDLAPDDLLKAAGEFLPLLAGTYGEISSSVAADFYEAMRGAAGVGGAFSASLSAPTAAGEVAKQVGWALSPVVNFVEGDAVGRMTAIVDAAALQQGRDTVVHNAARDPKKPRWARVPVGKTCAWCVMLASNGPVYRSAEKAGGAHRFHADCDCQPTPTWHHGEDLPGSYDESGLYSLYKAARDAAGSSKPKDIMAALRRLDGGRWVSDGVTS